MNTALMLYDPFRGVMRNGFRSHSDEDIQWLPKVDLIENKMNYIVEVELPGLAKQDINMNYENHTLSIEGQKDKSLIEEEKSLYRSERVFGKFKRSIQFGQDVDVEKVEAEMKHGLLRVVLPKRTESQARKIEILESKEEVGNE